jgi:hypothetical protein
VLAEKNRKNTLRAQAGAVLNGTVLLFSRLLPPDLRLFEVDEGNLQPSRSNKSFSIAATKSSIGIF